MMKTGTRMTAWVGGWLGLMVGAGPALGLTIVYPPEADPLEVLAAREVRRYLYVRTGELCPITTGTASPAEGDAVVFARPSGTEQRRLGSEGYTLTTAEHGGRRIVTISGGGPVGTLYGAYRFAEHLGVRFYLEGDVVPDERIPLELPVVKELGKPLFALRGIQPFHDFPEGPDWWSLDGYKAVISQLPKLRMNFFGLHTYPEGSVGPEPVVWIGIPEDVGPDGRVRHSYPSRHFSTANNTWGYAASERTRTPARYAFGAAQLFEHDPYSQDVQLGKSPWPTTPDDGNELFNDFGDKLKAAFEQARRLGVKTCVGTEIPLIVPRAVRERLAPATGPVKTLGGSVADYGQPPADTPDARVYDTVRWNADGYRLTVPNGRYRVTLKFIEIHHEAAARRVFGVKIQGRQVIEGLDLFARTGKNKPLDLAFDDVEVSDGTLAVDFVKQAEYPAIAAIVVEGEGFSLKVNCGGPTHGDYLSDDGQALTAEQLQRLYEGMFLRIMRAYPIDYYWFWTPEGWTWSNVSESAVETALTDIRHAMAAADKLNAPFQLATCGWVLGPQYDRALFDRELPKSMPVSCINRAVGHDPVEPGFANVEGRPKWAIPWLEDDPALASLQLWVGRMRKDALDAHSYGCTGLMGIHWRTRELGPNVAALAYAAWDQADWKQTSDPQARHLPAEDFYRDWAAAHFGTEAGPKVGELFARLDGKLPRPSDWVHGPGGLKPDERPWEEVAKLYAFVDEMEALRPLVRTPGNLDRFDHWLNQLCYLRATGRVNCLWGRYNKAAAPIAAEPDAAVRKRLARETLIPLRIELVQAVADAHRDLLATVSTTGAMGTVVNWQQHILPSLLDEPARVLTEMLGEPLPAGAVPTADYAGPRRAFVTEVRTLVSNNEPLALRVVVLAAAKPESGVIHWRPMGRGDYHTTPLTHAAAGVWLGQIPGEAAQGDGFEYHVALRMGGEDTLRFPAGAPERTQTVVVEPAGGR